MLGMSMMKLFLCYTNSTLIVTVNFNMFINNSQIIYQTMSPNNFFKSFNSKQSNHRLQCRSLTYRSPNHSKHITNSRTTIIKIIRIVGIHIVNQMVIKLVNFLKFQTKITRTMNVLQNPFDRLSVSFSWILHILVDNANSM